MPPPKLLPAPKPERKVSCHRSASLSSFRPDPPVPFTSTADLPNPLPLALAWSPLRERRARGLVGGRQRSRSLSPPLSVISLPLHHLSFRRHCRPSCAILADPVSLHVLDAAPLPRASH